MKAEESVKNYAASVRMYTNYTVREIKKICKTIGPRPAGYEAEKQAQEHIAEELKTCADEVKIEPFKERILNEWNISAMESVKNAIDEPSISAE